MNIPDDRLRKAAMRVAWHFAWSDGVWQIADEAMIALREALAASPPAAQAPPPAPKADAAGDRVLREFLEWAQDGSQDGHLDSGLLALAELARRSLATKEGA